jgi:hypothetical protein
MTRDDIIRMAREAGMDIDNEVAFSENDYDQDVNISDLQTFAALVAAASASVEPVSLKQIAAERGINMPENYVPTMDDAVAAVDGVLMNEQAALLRECRAALDSLIELKPALAGLHCGSTTLGNLKASLYEYRPQGVFGNTAPPQRDVLGPVPCPVSWKNAAIRLGEELSTVGPDGYYNMTAQQWLDWAMKNVTPARLAQPEQRTGDCLLTGVCAAEGHRIQKAQPEPEPVAWYWSNGIEFTIAFEKTDGHAPMYLHPPQREWQGLTENEKELLWDEAVEGREHFCSQYGNFADALEAKLKEKNT